MTALRPILRNPLVAGIAGAYLLSSAGCADASSDPTAVVLAQETQAALQVAGDLPSLPDLARRHGARGHAALEGVQLWEYSWSRFGAVGRGMREEAYARALPGLAGVMSDDAVADVLRDVDEALASAEGLRNEKAGPLPEPVAVRLSDARALLDQGFLARERGDRAEALRQGLGAADRLRSLSPERVVQGLLGRAEEALRRNASPDAYTPQELRRADRLVRGARSALEEGDLPRALRRAFYACQVLGVKLN